ncbi:temptin, partial [Plakobranchus ocellatus]
WTSALCNADSDGDGVSNGAELGDPSCTWTQGQTPDRTTDITHPGQSLSLQCFHYLINSINMCGNGMSEHGIGPGATDSSCWVFRT